MSINSYSQCVVNSTYQDSMPNVWPSSGFPDGMVGVYYYDFWEMKAPETLIEAAYGDTAFVTVDTLGNTIYIGDWPVDSVVTVDIYDLPPGIVVDCSTPNCTYLGGQIGCANIYGTPTTVGTYATDIVTNLYSHGVISINVGGVPLTLPVEINYFDVTGKYDTVSRYTINIVSPSSINEKENGLQITNIMNKNNRLDLSIYSSKNDRLWISITDILGREVYSSNLLVHAGMHEYNINKCLENGLYIITLNNNLISFSKKMQIADLNN